MSKGTILIADDEQDIRELLGDFMESEGYKCLLAEDAFKAQDILEKENDIDIIMSDIRMPGKSGLEFLEYIKKKDSDIIVIMISAVKDIESAIAAISKGAHDYISKPFKLNEVIMVANKAMEKRRLILENRAYQLELEHKVEERTIELRNALDELDNTYKFTLRALVTALDTRDEETQGHSLRVVRYTMKLAKIMNITDEEELKNIELGALLHDIGKIGIPDAILRKPGKLTPEEWKIMETHPQLGNQILNKIKFLEKPSIIVLHHHEKYNGTGYPDKLKEMEIPLGARIFGVADTVDAMTSDRPYRKALSFEIAKEELEKFSGTQFDPVVVKAFNELSIEEWKRERESLDKKIINSKFF